jgi:hypothetical protein
MRWLAPGFGTGIEVTSILIAVTLGTGALGVVRRRVAARGGILRLAFLLSGLAMLANALAGPALVDARAAPFIAGAASLAALVGPTAAALGAVVPLLARLRAPGRRTRRGPPASLRHRGKPRQGPRRPSRAAHGRAPPHRLWPGAAFVLAALPRARPDGGGARGIRGAGAGPPDSSSSWGRLLPGPGGASRGNDPARVDVGHGHARGGTAGQELASTACGRPWCRRSGRGRCSKDASGSRRCPTSRRAHGAPRRPRGLISSVLAARDRRHLRRAEPGAGGRGPRRARFRGPCSSATGGGLAAPRGPDLAILDVPGRASGHLLTQEALREARHASPPAASLCVIIGRPDHRVTTAVASRCAPSSRTAWRCEAAGAATSEDLFLFASDRLSASAPPRSRGRRRGRSTSRSFLRSCSRTATRWRPGTHLCAGVARARRP